MNAQALEGYRVEVLPMKPCQHPGIRPNRTCNTDAAEIGTDVHSTRRARAHAPSVMAITSISLTHEELERRVTHFTISTRSWGGIMSRGSCGLEEIAPSLTVIVPILPGLRHVTAMPSLRTTSRSAWATPRSPNFEAV